MFNVDVFYSFNSFENNRSQRYSMMIYTCKLVPVSGMSERQALLFEDSWPPFVHFMNARNEAIFTGS